jgi:hypothetical protein
MAIRTRCANAVRAPVGFGEVFHWPGESSYSGKEGISSRDPGGVAREQLKNRLAAAGRGDYQ